MRGRLERHLQELQNDIVKLATLVEIELKTALQALNRVDMTLVEQVFEQDESVNQLRFDIEEHCITLIATQQPAAGDLRDIITALHMIVDLERMGDQAKGISKSFMHLSTYEFPPELFEMGSLVVTMLQESILAFKERKSDVVAIVKKHEDEVDDYFTQIFALVSKQSKEGNFENCYEVIRIAQNLERCGDLATNLAERVVYNDTGNLTEINVN